MPRFYGPPQFVHPGASLTANKLISFPISSEVMVAGYTTAGIINLHHDISFHRQYFSGNILYFQDSPQYPQCESLTPLISGLSAFFEYLYPCRRGEVLPSPVYPLIDSFAVRRGLGGWRRIIPSEHIECIKHTKLLFVFGHIDHLRIGYPYYDSFYQQNTEYSDPYAN